jgi:hypothetical protein
MDEVKTLNWISVLIEGMMGLVTKRLYQATLPSDFTKRLYQATLPSDFTKRLYQATTYRRCYELFMIL